MAHLKHSLEAKEREVQAIAMEKKILQLDLEKALTSEKKLVSTVASLEAQVGIFKHLKKSLFHRWITAH